MRDAGGNDFDYLAARVHGRRSRLAEGPALDRLCQIRTVPELSRALDLPAEGSALSLQRTLVAEEFEEVSKLAAQLPGRGGDLLCWMRVRYQIENLKVLLRGGATGRSLESLQPYLLPLPPDLRLDLVPPDAVSGLEDVATLLPQGPLRKSLEGLKEPSSGDSRLFFLEAAMDRGYFCELLRRARCLRGIEGQYVMPLVRQEADLFHLVLAARGIWIHHLEPERLAPMHVHMASLSRGAFEAMLRAKDLAALARQGLGKGLDTAPPNLEEPGSIETLAWNRMLRLANHAFRASHMGLGAVVAFTALRRIERANLITLCEGIRAGVAPAVLRARLIPRVLPEAAHV